MSSVHLTHAAGGRKNLAIARRETRPVFDMPRIRTSTPNMAGSHAIFDFDCVLLTSVGFGRSQVYNNTGLPRIHDQKNTQRLDLNPRSTRSSLGAVAL